MFHVSGALGSMTNMDTQCGGHVTCEHQTAILQTRCMPSSHCTWTILSVWISKDDPATGSSAYILDLHTMSWSEDSRICRSGSQSCLWEPRTAPVNPCLIRDARTKLSHKHWQRSYIHRTVLRNPYSISNSRHKKHILLSFGKLLPSSLLLRYSLSG